MSKIYVCDAYNLDPSEDDEGFDTYAEAREVAKSKSMGRAIMMYKISGEHDEVKAQEFIYNKDVFR